jgi:hypothetical protein
MRDGGMLGSESMDCFAIPLGLCIDWPCIDLRAHWKVLQLGIVIQNDIGSLLIHCKLT